MLLESGLPRLLVKNPFVGEEPVCWCRAEEPPNLHRWLPLVDMFRTFYFNEFTNLKEDLETIKTSFILA